MIPRKISRNCQNGTSAGDVALLAPLALFNDSQPSGLEGCGKQRNGRNKMVTIHYRLARRQKWSLCFEANYIDQEQGEQLVSGGYSGESLSGLVLGAYLTVDKSWHLKTLSIMECMGWGCCIARSARPFNNSQPFGLDLMPASREWVKNRWGAAASSERDLGLQILWILFQNWDRYLGSERLGNGNRTSQGNS